MINIASNIRNRGVSGNLALAAGVAGLALIGYDAHHTGKEVARETEKEEKSDSLVTHFLEDRKLDSPSVVKSAVKKQIFLYHLDENLTDFFANIKGYCEGFTKMAVGNSIPLALSAGAIFTKGFFSKSCGLGLALYGGIFLLQEAFGIGKSRE